MWMESGPDPEVSPSSSAICDLVSWIHPDRRGQGRGCWCASWQLSARRTPSLTVPSLTPDNVRISPNGSIITIVGTRPSNHGAYRCVASNAYGVAQSVVNLSVHGESLQPHGSASPFPAPIPSSEPPGLNPASAPCLSLGRAPSLSLSLFVGTVGRPVPTGSCQQGPVTARDQQGPECVPAVSFLRTGPPTVSVLPEGPVRVKLGKDVTLECVSGGEPRSSARWTRIGAPTHLEQRAHGLLDSHTVLQVRPGRLISGSEAQSEPILEQILGGERWVMN